MYYMKKSLYGCYLLHDLLLTVCNLLQFKEFVPNTYINGSASQPSRYISIIIPIMMSLASKKFNFKNKNIKLGKTVNTMWLTIIIVGIMCLNWSFRFVLVTESFLFLCRLYFSKIYVYVMIASKINNVPSPIYTKNNLAWISWYFSRLKLLDATTAKASTNESAKIV